MCRVIKNEGNNTEFYPKWVEKWWRHTESYPQFYLSSSPNKSKVLKVTKMLPTLTYSLHKLETCMTRPCTHHPFRIHVHTSWVSRLVLMCWHLFFYIVKTIIKMRVKPNLYSIITVYTSPVFPILTHTLVIGFTFIDITL